MIIDIAKFLFIFFLVLTSFACGLNQLYWYYDTGEYCRPKTIGDNVTIECHHNPDAFMTLEATYATLFWSLFGITSTKSTDLVEDHVFVETVGQGLYLAYHVGSIIVLINMLIAMMSNSFQNIEDHADREWKFARSKLWLGYFDEGSTLPAPFNLIVSPKSIYYFLCSCKDIVVSLCRTSRDKYGSSKSKTINDTKPTSNGNSEYKRRMNSMYQDIMKRLVSRYIHQIKKQLRQDGVNEDDLLEIKQDISSLRYELREDRKHETARCAGHIDSIKRDIIRSLRGTGWNMGTGPGPPDPHLYQGGVGGPFTNQHDLEYLKREIVTSLKSELRSIVKETLHGTSTSSQQMPATPEVESELYQTHLYTQL